MDIRGKLINLRNSEKLSQQEFADMLDVSRITVARWESGKNSPSSAQLAKICKVFKLDYTRLMDSSDEVPYINEPETPNSTGAEDSKEHAEAESSGAYKLSRRKFIGLMICLGLIAAVAVAGLIVTIVYAVKDAMYDASSTVWIISIPRNTPMIVLCIFLFIFIVIIGAIMFYLFRRRKQ